MTDKSVVLLDVGGTFVKGGLADSTGELADGLTWQVPIRSDGSRKEILESLEKSLREGIMKSKEPGMSAVAGETESSLVSAGVSLPFSGPQACADAMPSTMARQESIALDNFPFIIP